VEFQQFLQGAGPSTQILDSIPTIPSTSTSALLPISNRNEISQFSITIGHLSIEVSTMSLDDSEDEGKENEDGDENGKDSSYSEVGDVSMYTGDNNNVEVRSCAFFLAEYIIYLLHYCTSKLPGDAADEESSPHSSLPTYVGENDNFDVCSVPFPLQT
jgi:hypothetical protein